MEIIQWDLVSDNINNNVNLPLVTKRTLLVILRLLGEPIELISVNNLNDALFDIHKHKVIDLKARAANFFNHMQSNNMTIDELR